MNKAKLTELLIELAEKDLSEGSDINDHPCAVAVRALEQCFNDINALQSAFRGKEKNMSKKIQTLMRLNYNPSY